MSFQAYDLLEEKALECWSCFGIPMKVKYRNVHTIGQHFNCNIIVADEMLILPEKKGKAK